MNKIDIKRENWFHFPEHYFFLFLEDNYILDQNGFVTSEDMTKDFNEYMLFKDRYSVRHVALMIMKILPRIERISKDILTNDYGEKRRRGFKGLSKNNK